ncbi:MAG: hypothetical protein PQJ46_15325 [Spirochaetales bacterium]|nr:hypothetical protein [Spirochaetales bacterium]
MKKHILLLLLPILAFTSCTTFTSRSFSPDIDGYGLATPVNVEVLEKSIQLASTHYHWQIEEQYEGKIIASFQKGEGVIYAQIEIDYDEAGYSIHYLNSRNIDADLTRMTIHKNFVRWVANLNKGIYTYYLKFS